MTKQNLAVVFGGPSPEHEISILTGLQVIEAADRSKYTLVPLYWSKDNRWYTGEYLTNIAHFSNLDKVCQQSREVYLARQNDKVVLLPVQSTFLPKKSTPIDVVFPTTHGGKGENGSVQGLFELLDVPFVGAGVTGGALGMDKVVMKQLMTGAGIATAPYTWFYEYEWKKSRKDILVKLVKKHKFPMFVKPATGGSSIGTTKVMDKKALEQAVDLACAFDSKVIVETGLTGAREINISVMGNHTGELTASVCSEVRLRESDFFTFDEKYIGGGKGSKGKGGMANSGMILPAKMSPALYNKISNLAMNTYRLLNCDGIARIDCLVVKDVPHVIEINTLPGDMSYYLWKASGVSFAELINKLVDLALSRHTYARSKISSFTTNVLSQYKEGFHK